MFARDVGTAPPYETVKVVAINETIVTKEGVQVSPGDVVIADLNGVVIIPQDRLDQVVDLIPAQVRADEQMSEAIKDGMSFVEAGKKFRTTYKVDGQTYEKQEGSEAIAR